MLEVEINPGIRNGLDSSLIGGSSLKRNRGCMSNIVVRTGIVSEDMMANKGATTSVAGQKKADLPCIRYIRSFEDLDGYESSSGSSEHSFDVYEDEDDYVLDGQFDEFISVGSSSEDSEDEDPAATDEYTVPRDKAPANADDKGGSNSKVDGDDVTAGDTASGEPINIDGAEACSSIGFEDDCTIRKRQSSFASSDDKDDDPGNSTDDSFYANHGGYMVESGSYSPYNTFDTFDDEAIELYCLDAQFDEVIEINSDYESDAEYKGDDEEEEEDEDVVNTKVEPVVEDEGARSGSVAEQGSA